jgi:hypothetical protein
MGIQAKVVQSVGIEPGDYTAEVTKIEPKTLQFGDVLEFTFRLLDGDPNAAYDTVAGIANFGGGQIKVGSTLYKWLSILNGGDLQLNADLDISAFIGRQCKVLVENKPGKKEGQVFSKIKEVMPIRKGQAPMQAQAKPSTPSAEKKVDAEFDKPVSPAPAQQPAAAPKKDFDF